MGKRHRWAARWLLVGVWVLVAASAAGARFGVGLVPEWTTFQDPSGRFAVDVPPGWTYQADASTDEFFVFYGPGQHDLFYVEILESAGSAPTPAAHAEDAIARYAAPGGLDNFQVISHPAAGSLAEKEASFIVYAYTDAAGASIVEGRAFVLHEGKVFTLAFADADATFDERVSVFNQVMESFQLFVTPSPNAVNRPGAGFGVTAPPPSAESGTPKSAPVPPVADGSMYTSPGGYYRFMLPDGWDLWEEQATARGDAIEPWNGVFAWSGRPMTKSLFLWDYFDEWEQKGAQYEIVLAVIDNVPGTHDEAIEALKSRVMGASEGTYTTQTRRARIGRQAGLAAQIVVRPGLVEPWSMVSEWYKTVTFYTFKDGNTFFVWVIPNEIADHPAVTEAMGSFQWLAR